MRIRPKPAVPGSQPSAGTHGAEVPSLSGPGISQMEQTPAPRAPDGEDTLAEPSFGEVPSGLLRDVLKFLEGEFPSGSSDPGSGQDGADTGRPVHRIGRYEILEPIGSGGFAIVYRALDPTLQRLRALKIPLPDVLASPERRKRFLADGIALARLDHPNIVRVYDADRCGGVCYIAMELCDGGSLAGWLKRLPARTMIPASWAAEIVQQIASGVQHAHDRGIYHRDLKPDNILLVPLDGSVAVEPVRSEPMDGFPRFVAKVSDFGLAKFLGDAGPVESTAPGVLLGTRQYMAPEQVRGDSSAFGPATDVYSLGVILYELLTRRRPFEGAGEVELMDLIREADPAPPGTFRGDLPPDLETVSLKCLEKHARDRYQRPSELANELARVLQRMPTLARPAPWWKKSVRVAKRHPMAVSLLVTFTLAILAGAWFLEHVRRNETDLLLRRLAVAGLEDLPALVAHLDPTDAFVRDRLSSLFVTGKPHARLAAAMLLAEQHPEYREFCFGGLLDAPPHDLAALAPLSKERLPGLIPRLESIALQPAAEYDADPEAADRRRANAACTLGLLGRNDVLWQLLRTGPDPQLRSFLVQYLGPSGMDLAKILDRLEDPETEITARMALIQSLDAVPAESWKAPLRKRAEAWLLDRYENDPHAGVHGSVKWLLKRWGFADTLAEIDRERLRDRQPDPLFAWRISREGLTLITVDDPALDQIIEVSDTEITMETFRKFDSRVHYSPEISPEERCPVNGICYHDAAAFCNWLSLREGVAAAALCYRAVRTEEGMHERPQTIHEPTPGSRLLAGFRLPTGPEFDAMCAAGTRSRRYHGDGELLFGRYAWTLKNSEGRAHPVGSLLPNDLGVFDTIGNLEEWCEATQPPGADLRGGHISYSPPSAMDRFTASRGILAGWRAPSQGFRVVRTVRPRDQS